MLKLKNMFENYALARLALENWEHDEKGLEEYLKHFRISSNAVYPFSVHGKRCFLRLAPVEEKQEQNLRGELAFLQYLNRSGFPAMASIMSRDGRDLLKLETRWGAYYASAFVGVPGKSVESTDYCDEIMTAYGKTLGRLHSLSAQYEPDHRKWSYSDALAWVRAVLLEHHAPQIMHREADRVEQALSKLERDPKTYGLVHYDFEPDNVFYDATDGSCHVIDFEDGMYHFFLVDIEQVLDALAGELGAEALSRAKSCFLKGYANEMQLEPDYERKLPIMRSFCNLYAYARLIRCTAETLPEEPDWMQNLRVRLEKKKRYLECLAEKGTMN